MSEYGKRTSIESIRYECYRMDKGYIIGVPLILLFLGIFTRWISGSPLATLHYVDAKGSIPAVWVMILLFSLSYIAAGLSLGAALGKRGCAYTERKYQGAMWFCICLAIGYAWYPIFFCARLFLVSLIASALCLFSGACVAICFYRVSRLAFTFAVIYDAWLLYLAFLNLQIFFAI